MNSRFFLIFSVAALLLAACKQDTPAPQKRIVGTMEGHKRMIAILDSIAQNANPIDCYNLNSKMAAMLEPQIAAQTDPNKRVVAQFKYAEQLLYAGKTEAATMQLLDISRQFGNVMSEGNKLVYQYLALSYLRLGEQQNCINTHTPESCILPLQGGGIYKMKSGPETAIGLYEQILERFPNDLDSRWLLNIAYMTLGKYPSGVPKKYLIPTSVFQKKGDLHFKEIAISLGLDMRGLSGGVCMEDFDNDGDLDLFMTSYGLNQQCRYYRNNGDGTFAERTHEANLDGIVSGLNTLHADYDNDGDRDIVILRAAGSKAVPTPIPYCATTATVRSST